jgi:hypothetical protein
LRESLQKCLNFFRFPSDRPLEFESVFLRLHLHSKFIDVAFPLESARFGIGNKK